jgi:hypothetical protein
MRASGPRFGPTGLPQDRQGVSFFLVGVAGFEPTASSSRNNSSDAATRHATGVGRAETSLGVRESLRVYAVVVTQFVTHPTSCAWLSHHLQPSVADRSSGKRRYGADMYSP